LAKHNVPVEKDVRATLSEKLKAAEHHTIVDQPKETLYNVADMLTKLYNPLHEDGVMKKKVFLLFCDDSFKISRKFALAAMSM